MKRGIYRRTFASWTVAVFLMVAMPPSADAWILEPSTRGQVESMREPAEREAAFWGKIWATLESLWQRTSVLIIPDGEDTGDGEEEGEGSQEGEGEGDAGNDS